MGFFLSFVFLAVSFVVGGSLGLPPVLLLIPIGLLIIGGIGNATPFLRRRRGTWAIARRFGWTYELHREVDWYPPGDRAKAKSRRFYNVLEGDYQGNDVLIFDCFAGSNSRFFSVVRISSDSLLPHMLIGGGLLCDLPSVRIPGTRYYLFGEEKACQQPVQYLSADLIDFLRRNSGLVIESRSTYLTVYCDRWFSTVRRVPESLPAFLTDISHLRELLHESRTPPVETVEATGAGVELVPNTESKPADKLARGCLLLLIAPFIVFPIVWVILFAIAVSIGTWQQFNSNEEPAPTERQPEAIQKNADPAA